MRVALAIIATGLFAALLILGPQQTNANGPFWAGRSASLPPSGTCGGESAPAQAVAAGFTTCAANFDWTQSTGASWLPSAFAFSGAVSTTANWLDCTAFGTSPTLPFHNASTPTSLCGPSNIAVATDGGTQVLQMTNSSNAASGDQNLQISNQVSGGYSVVPGTFTFPFGAYIEVKYRIVSIVSNGDENGPYTWSNGGSSGGGYYYGINIETFANGFADFDSGGGSTAFPWVYMSTNPSFSNCNTNPPPGFVCTPTVSGYAVTQYHRYGLLLTQDGATAQYVCYYIDGQLQSCNGPIGSETVGSYSGTPSDFNIRMWMFWQGFNQPSQPGVSQMNIQYERVWSCAGFASGNCNGSTLFNTNGLTYWHN